MECMFSERYEKWNYILMRKKKVWAGWFYLDGKWEDRLNTESVERFCKEKGKSFIHIQDYLNLD